MVALGRIRLQRADESGVADVVEMPKYVLKATPTPSTQNFAAWFLALSAGVSGRPVDAHD